MQKQIQIFISLLVLFSLTSERHLKKVTVEQYQSEIESYGYKFEDHTVTTSDGYILHIWRIQNPKVEKNKKVAILQHGVGDSSYTFFALQKDYGLAYLVADKGYDVWLPNTRGNIFSYEHTNKDFDAFDPFSDYWNLSFEQIAEIDLPTIIDYVKEQTKVEKIDYIGHSQGTTIFMLKYMLDPEYLEKNINKFVALGPVPNIVYAENFLINLFKQTELLDLYPLNSIFFFDKTQREVFSNLASLVPDLIKEIIDPFIGTIPTGRINYEKHVPHLLLFEPGGTSKMSLQHWIQVGRKGHMQRFDYGKEKNLEKYGTIEPPAYNEDNIKKWNIKSFFTMTNTDTFSSIKDVTEFLNRIENKSVIQLLILKNYNHLDYTWSEDSRDEIYVKALKFLEY